MKSLLRRFLPAPRTTQSPSRIDNLIRRAIENLEDRVTPSAALTDPPVALSIAQVSNPQQFTSGSAPMTLMSPLDPYKIVTVYSTGGGLGIRYSTDRGESWQGAGVGSNLYDPTSGGTYSTVRDPFIAFDRAGFFYVIYTQENIGTTSGVIALKKFDFTGNNVNEVNNFVNTAITNVNESFDMALDNTAANSSTQVLYRWANQDRAQTPTLAVNSNNSLFLDPTAPSGTATQRDALSGRQFLVAAWSVAALNGNFLHAAASDNGGLSFSTPQSLGTGTLPTAFYLPNGSLTFMWNSGGGVVTDVSTPFATRDLSLPYTVQTQFVFTPDTTLAPGGGPFSLSEKSPSLNFPRTPADDLTGLIRHANRADPGDPNGTPPIPAIPAFPRSTTFNTPTPVTIPTNISFDTLVDMEVTVNMVSLDMSFIKLELIAPDGTIVTLLQNRFRADGTPEDTVVPTSRGLAAGTQDFGTYGSVYTAPNATTGPFLGNFSLMRPAGVIFDDQAARRVNDTTNVANFASRFRPELGALSVFNGRTAAQLNGTWVLKVTNYRVDSQPEVDPPEIQLTDGYAVLVNWGIKFVSRMNDGSFGTDRNASSTAGAATTIASPIVGIQGWYSTAVDTTQGAFSPYRNRWYLATTGDGGDDTNIYVATSDDNGQNWSNRVQVNDDTSSDGFSTGSRAQFQPTIAVDPTTGTVVVMWYDARNDGSNARVATYIATSIDGGKTWSRATYLNETKTAQNAIDRSVVNIDPIPTNLSGFANGFGTRQGLAVFDGTVIPIWSGNQNNTNQELWTARTRIADGPRVLTGDSGTIDTAMISSSAGPAQLDLSNSGITISRPATNPATLNSLYVKFSRRIDPSLFTPSFISTSMSLGSLSSGFNPIANAIQSITPLDATGDGAYEFLVTFTPQQFSLGFFNDIFFLNFPQGLLDQDVVSYINPNTASLYNNTFSIDGTRQLSSFFVRFDRPIDPTTFTTSDIRLMFRDPNTAASLPAEDLSSAILSITALDTSTFGPNNVSGATRFLVTLTPQSRVGTYSYAIGPDVRTRIRNQYSFNTYATPATVADPTTNTEVGTVGIPLGRNATALVPTVVTSTIAVSGLLGTLADVNVRLSMAGSGNSAENIKVILISPTGQQIMLSDRPASATANTIAFTNVVFDDQAALSVNDTQPGFPPQMFGIVRPHQALSTLTPTTVNGNWTLRIELYIPTIAASTLRLMGWSMQITTAPSPVTGSTNPGAVILPGAFVNSDIFMSGSNLNRIQNLTVGANITGGQAGDLRLTLEGPDGQTITLSDRRPGNGLGGAAFANTVFDSISRNSILNATTPYTTVAPEQSLNLFQDSQINGRWRLRVTNNGNTSVTLNSWLLNFLVNNIQLDQQMDQDGDGITGEINNDEFSNPRSTSGVPFQLGYDKTTLPLMITGPQVVNVSVVGTADTTDNLLLNGPVSAIDVTFDRDMNAATFTPSTVIELRLPTGQTITGPFTITANPAGTPPALASRTFRISFAPQTLSGYYSLVLDSSIRSVSGAALDTNKNAGIDVLFGSVVNPALSGTTPVLSNSTSSLSIPTGGTPVTSSITITDPFIITQLASSPIQLTMNITHPDTRDLSVVLVAPDGRRIQLTDRDGQFGVTGYANFTNTIFNDFATDQFGNLKLVQQAQAPFNAGPYTPRQQLSILSNGTTLSTGVWQLEVTNHGTSAGTLTGWSLRLPKPNIGTGLGEPIADRATVGFRIFTLSPSQTVSTTAWTPIGATANSADQYTGQVNVIAVDSSDPSGNTVYVGGKTGGVWKTTNFLTENTNGPIWIPLTDFGALNSLQITSLAVTARNNDPNQSIVMVGLANGPNNSGVGMLRSMDGGRTWKVLNSTNNADASGNILPIDSGSRNNLFTLNATTVNKIVVDPVTLPNGEYIMYAAMSGSATTNGIWRSRDTGKSWTRIHTGNATDFVLGLNDQTGPNGVAQPQVARFGYAAIQDTGVFFSSTISVTGSLLPLNGGIGKPLFQVQNAIIPVTAPPSSPNGGASGKILLAAPNATSDPVANSFYQGWLYAMSAQGIYMTKDYGANWTRLSIPADGIYAIPPYPPNSSNNDSLQQMNFTTDTAGSIMVDPTNPNIIYIGSYRTGIYKIDVTTLSDAHAFVARDNTAGGTTAAAGVVTTTNGGITVNSAPNNQYYNYLRSPTQPFTSNAVQNISGSIGITAFNNTGFDVRVSRLESTNGATLNSLDFTGMVSIVDTLTGRTRLMTSTSQGVYTAVDSGNSERTQGLYNLADVSNGIGTIESVHGRRHGNLQLNNVITTGLQPSSLAADLAGLFQRRNNSPSDPIQQTGVPLYSIMDEGYYNPDRSFLSTGNDNWNGNVVSPINNLTGGFNFVDGLVETDPSGSGIIYQYRPPVDARSAGVNEFDFFMVTLPGAAPIGRTFGLLDGDTPPDSLNILGTGQWATRQTAYFAVNPADNRAIVISAPNARNADPVTAVGRVYLTTDMGLSWAEIGSPAEMNNSQGTAQAFGAPVPGLGTTTSIIYNGTAAGEIFVTSTASGPWTNISAGLDGSRIMKIITNPQPGSRELFAITRAGVYHMADSSLGLPWVNITGNLFALTRPAFGEATVRPSLRSLEALAIDWRFTTPVLYVGGDGGVYRTTNRGVTWTNFPNIAADGSSAEGGYMPYVRVTDLDIAYGSINPSGVYDQSTAPNMLVASTDGRGLFAIRLNANAVPPSLGTSGPWVNETPANIVVTQPTPTGTAASVRLLFGDPAPTNPPVNQIIDPATLVPSAITLTDPLGNVIPVTIVDSSPLTGNGTSSSNLFTFNFNATVSGNYVFVMNQSVADMGGRLLNQNKNTVNGENPTDRFVRIIPITVNAAPTITPLNTVFTPQNTPATVNLTVNDDVTAPASITVTATSSNTTLVPNNVANLAVTPAVPTNGNRTITITPVTGQYGNTTIIVTATDAAGRSTISTFTVYVVPVRTAPFSDNFNRPDNTNLGNEWVQNVGNTQISGNTNVITTPVGLSTVIGLSQLNSQQQADVSLSFANGAGSQTGLVARYSGNGDSDMYWAGLVYDGTNTTGQIRRNVGGVWTTLSVSSVVASPAGTIRFEIINNSLKLFFNNTLITYAYDTAITATGLSGIRATQGNRLDNFNTVDIALTTVALPAVAPTTTDSFTQVDGTQLSRNWQDRLGNMNVVGNRMVAQGPLNISTYNITPTAADLAAQISLNNLTAGSVGLIARYTGTLTNADSNYYLGIAEALPGGTTIRIAIWKNVAGVYTQLSNWTTINSVTGTFRFEVEGTSLKLFFNNVLQSFAFDNQLTGAGLVGLRTQTGGAGDDFFAQVTSKTETLGFTDTFATNPPRNQLSTSWQDQFGNTAITAVNSAVGQTPTNVATVNGISVADVSLTAGINLTADGQAFGLIARYSGLGDATMYWGAILRTGATTFSAYIFRIQNGALTLLNSQSFTLPPTGTLRFDAIGANLRLFLNNTILVTASDIAISGPGLVGVRTNAGGVMTSFGTAAPVINFVTLNYTTPISAGPNNFLNADWQDQVGTHSVSGATATAQAVGTNLATLNILPANQQRDVSLSMNTALDGGEITGLVGRYQGTGDRNFYWGAIYNDGAGNRIFFIMKDVNGTSTYLAAVGEAGTSNGTLRFDIIGESLKLYFNGVLKAFASDTQLSGVGSVGFRSNAGAQVDTFQALIATNSTATLPYVNGFDAPGFAGQLSTVNTEWRQNAGNFTVSGSRVTAQGLGTNLATLNILPANQSADVSVSGTSVLTAGQVMGLVARHQGPGDNNLYFGAVFDVGGGQRSFFILKVVGGVTTTLAALPQAVIGSANGLLRFDVIGASLKLYFNNALVLYAQDFSLTGVGSVGIRSTQGASLTDFNASVLTGTTPPIPFLDSFNAVAPGNQLSSNWREQAGNFNLAGNQAVGQAPFVNLATLNGVSRADVSVSSNVRFTSVNQTVGLVARHSGPGDSNMYFAGLVSTGSGNANIYLYKNVGGVWTEINSFVLINLYPGDIYTNTLFNFTVTGSTLSVSVNGLLRGQVTDTSITAAGSVGIRGSAGGIYDDFIVS